MAKTAERKAYDELLKKHYPSGRARGKPISNEVEKQIRAALAKAEASEAITPRPNPRSAASRDAARDARAEKAQALKDDKLVRKMEKQGALKKAGKSQRFRPAPLPVQKVDELKAVHAKIPEKTAKQKKEEVEQSRNYITANFTDGVKFKKGPDSNVSKTALTAAAKGLAPNKKDGLTEGMFGTRKGTAAIESFFKDTLGIDDVKVDYTFPGDEGYGTPPEDRQSRKSGGKVTAKRPTAKKYAMNRGGVASVRKPTRA
jgi:hypothetical protein